MSNDYNESNTRRDEYGRPLEISSCYEYGRTTQGFPSEMHDYRAQAPLDAATVLDVLEGRKTLPQNMIPLRFRGPAPRGPPAAWDMRVPSPYSMPGMRAPRMYYIYH